MPKSAPKFVDKEPPFKSVYVGFDQQEAKLMKANESAENLVWLDLKLLGAWTDKNISEIFARTIFKAEVVRVTTTIGAIKRKLSERHGGVKNLELYRGADKKTKLINDDMTLMAMGIQVLF